MTKLLSSRFKLIFALLLILVMVLCLCSFSYNTVPTLYGSTWVFKSNPDVVQTIGGISFSSNGRQFSKITLSNYYGTKQLSYDNTLVYTAGVGWVDDKYKSITFNYGSTTSTPDTASILEFMNSVALRSSGLTAKTGSFAMYSSIHLPNTFDSDLSFSGPITVFVAGASRSCDSIYMHYGMDGPAITILDGSVPVATYNAYKWSYHPTFVASTAIAPTLSIDFSGQSGVSVNNLYTFLYFNSFFTPSSFQAPDSGGSTGGGSTGGGSTGGGSTGGGSGLPDLPSIDTDDGFFSFLLDLVGWPFKLLGSWLEPFVSMFTVFSSSVAAVTAWIPAPVQTALWSIFLIALIIGIFKLIRG